MEELSEGIDFNYFDGQPFLSTANHHYHHNNCYGNHDLLTVDSPSIAITVDKIRMISSQASLLDIASINQNDIAVETLHANL